MDGQSGLRQNAETRDQMSSYWQQHDTPTIEAMMLDENAAQFSELDEREIWTLLPQVRGKRVLELGAGIGRFTGKLAEESDQTIAVDFMESHIAKNQEMNGHIANTEFECADVTKLRYQQQKFDLVFSNWLLMYLSDKEVFGLMANILVWLTDGGYLFFRESCFQQSGNKKRQENPTVYRSPSDYNKLLNEVNVESGGECIFDVITISQMQTYIKRKNNPNQFGWLVRKRRPAVSIIDTSISSDTNSTYIDPHARVQELVHSFKKTLDKKCIIANGHSDACEGFVSAPGEKTLQLGPNIHQQRSAEADTTIHKLVRADELSEEKDEDYDCVISSDYFYHLQDKPSLLNNIHDCLRVGGRLQFTDICVSTERGGDYYREWAESRKLYHVDASTYRKLLTSAGFSDVDVTDQSQRMIDSAQRDLDFLNDHKDELLEDCGDEEFEEISASLQATIRRCHGNNQTWMKISAIKL